MPGEYEIVALWLMSSSQAVFASMPELGAILFALLSSNEVAAAWTFFFCNLGSATTFFLITVTLESGIVGSYTYCLLSDCSSDFWSLSYTFLKGEWNLDYSGEQNDSKWSFVGGV